jgi:phosphoribosylglycinamide formyltransferase-1
VKKLRLGVLASGGGTNLQALLDACASPTFPAQVAVVVSNVRTAFALSRAQKAGVPTLVLPHQDAPSREAHDAQVAATLLEHQVELVCLAGYMRIVGKSLLAAFPQRIVNIHPALLPAFPGLHGPRQALAHGVKVAGCTVHFVDEGTDTGPIIAQAAVPVLPGDTEESLSARILVEEHRLYLDVVRALAEGRVKINGRNVEMETERPQS